MQIKYSTDIHFPARKVSLQQLASLWSAVMACLPEVRRCSAEFNRRGRVTGSYVYNDPDELAHADLDVRPGELELRYIHISGPDIDVTIGQHWDTSFWGMLLFKSTALNVCISGSNECDILRLRTAVEQWGERHLVETSRLTLWLKLGVLAARVFPARNFPGLRYERNRSALTTTPLCANTSHICPAFTPLA